MDGGGGGGDDRRSYLRQLVDEINKTTSHEAKCQVLANLSNFAYDPSNCEHLKEVGALNIFLDHLQDSDETLTHFASSAICNLSLDPSSADFFIRRNVVDSLINLLPSSCEEIKLNAITSLMFLSNRETEIASNRTIVKFMQDLKKSTNPRFSNLATIFLEDVCKERSP